MSAGVCPHSITEAPLYVMGQRFVIGTCGTGGGRQLNAADGRVLSECPA